MKYIRLIFGIIGFCLYMLTNNIVTAIVGATLLLGVIVGPSIHLLYASIGDTTQKRKEVSTICIIILSLGILFSVIDILLNADMLISMAAVLASGIMLIVIYIPSVFRTLFSRHGNISEFIRWTPLSTQ
jgi:hypothetical protein